MRVTALSLISFLTLASAFTSHPKTAATFHRSSSTTGTSNCPKNNANHYCRNVLSMVSAEDKGVDLGLTPELKTITEAFGSIPEEKTRYKQLLYMANQLPPIDPAVCVAENKVPGCLSTVFVDCTAKPREEDGELVVHYVGDSDGLLTKGLVALLIRGLNGCTPEEISKVNPEFINAAKISQSLTPGRNNGFLNMLAVMKKKAQQAAAAASSSTSTKGNGETDADGDEGIETAPTDNSIVTSFDEREGKPMYNAIMGTLIQLLKPTEIELVDNSDQHAGHAGSKGWEESGESHFELRIVAEAFDGLSLVKRHQLIYLMLGDIMQKIHALSISAKSPEEVATDD